MSAEKPRYTSDVEANRLRATLSLCTNVFTVGKFEMLRLLDTRDALINLLRDTANEADGIHTAIDNLTMEINP